MLGDVVNSTVTSAKGQPEEKKRADEELKTTTTTTTQSPSPILAFKVTFPPRPSSTLPPPPPTPSFLLRRFTSSRPTSRPTMPTTLRSFNSKFNKPAINNLVGVPAPFATGIQSNDLFEYVDLLIDAVIICWVYARARITSHLVTHKVIIQSVRRVGKRLISSSRSVSIDFSSFQFDSRKKDLELKT